LIEEAAETLEGTIIASMFESLQQLILIGDHQQLQAHCNLAYLEEAPYNLGVSMFERLVKNGIEYTMLNRQRRMIPQIREILSQFYPQLKDHESVLDRVHNRPHVPGMNGVDTFFFHHQWPESRDESGSRYNLDEAEMIVEFFDYLVLNNVNPSQITVLTFYNGQRTTILKMLRRHPNLQGYAHFRNFFKVFTVDSYQGEENDIVLLSLVRSNDKQSMGFLDSANRAVVALSRARRGLYVFGNALTVVVPNTPSFDLWGGITDTFRENDRLEHRLPLTCSTHGNITEVLEPIEWKNFGLTGGCKVKCRGSLPCRHACPHNCHP